MLSSGERFIDSPASVKQPSSPGRRIAGVLSHTFQLWPSAMSAESASAAQDNDKGHTKSVCRGLGAIVSLQWIELPQLSCCDPAVGS